MRVLGTVIVIDGNGRDSARAKKKDKKDSVHNRMERTLSLTEWLPKKGKEYKLNFLSFLPLGFNDWHRRRPHRFPLLLLLLLWLLSLLLSLLLLLLKNKLDHLFFSAKKIAVRSKHNFRCLFLLKIGPQ